MTNEKITPLFTTEKGEYIPLYITDKIRWSHLSDFQQRWLSNQGVTADLSPQKFIIIPDEKGDVEAVYIAKDREITFTLGEAQHSLPPGTYLLSGDFTEEEQKALLLGFFLGSYQFDKYRTTKPPKVRFYLPEGIATALLHSAQAHKLTRDLINEPPNHLTTDNLSTLIKAELSDYPITIQEWRGEALLKDNFPLIYTVGAGSEYKPRFLEITYGQSTDPALTIVGKGVCFDTGGLDIKPSSGMRLMKKDMGGAAHAVALAKWIMAEQLPLSLRLLLPIVENSLSQRAMRPSDIVKARNGLTVEIDNTDAEGRLILADALSYATEQRCDLLINIATLTGAARVALGPELPALFSNDDHLANILLAAGEQADDPLWRLPLHRGYQSWIEPDIADLANSAKYPQGGAITAALFLEHFIAQKESLPFAHIDVMAWNIRQRPGRPIGGEAMGLRALFNGICHYLLK